MVGTNQVKEIQYQIPIKEFGEVDNEFKIKGVAINETTTSNGHKFLAEELSSSASTLNGVPLLKDHNNSVDSIIGRVKLSYFDEVNKNIRFEAIIMDSKVKEMVKDGRINSVSVGASVKDLEEDDDGALIARGIMFHELSVVAVPADSNATFNVALMEAYNNISEKSEENNIQLKGGLNENTMSEEAEKPVETTEEETKTEEPKTEEPKAEPEATEEAEVEAKIKKLQLELKKKELAILESKLKEADTDEEPEAKEEAKEEEAEEEDEEEEAVEENFKVVKEGGFGSTSFTVVRNKY